MIKAIFGASDLLVAGYHNVVDSGLVDQTKGFVEKTFKLFTMQPGYSSPLARRFYTNCCLSVVNIKSDPLFNNISLRNRALAEAICPLIAGSVLMNFAGGSRTMDRLFRLDTDD